MHKSSALIVGLLLLASCSKVHQLDKRTESMEKNTSNLSKTSADINQTAGVTIEQLRSGASETTRRENFNEVLSKKGMGEKLVAAGVYYKAFEFQLWSGISTFDTRDARYGFFLDASNEITKKFSDLYEEVGKSTDRMSPSSNNDAQKTFYAFAATMHQNHNFQKNLGATTGVEVNSFYDLVTKALRRDKNHKHLEPYETVLVNGPNLELLIELLKARVDIIAGIALNNFTVKKKMTFGQKMKGLFFVISDGHFGSIDLPETYETSNDSTKEWDVTYLEYAIATKNFLEQELGIKKELNKTIKSAFENLDFTKSGDDKDLTRAKITTLINTLTN